MGPSWPIFKGLDGMRALVAIAAAAVLSACAGGLTGLGGAAGLKPGATEAEVEKAMGPSVDRRQKGGEITRYYSRLPHGRQMYAARFGADGKLIAIEQRLTEDNAAKLKPHVTRADQVRELLGPPHRVMRYPLQKRDVWEYPMIAFGAPKVLHVEFGPDQLLHDIHWQAEGSDDPT